MPVASLGEILHGGEVTCEEIDRVRATVVFEPPDLSIKLVRFFILLTLASAISTYGLLSDSVAAVIGAMIVAPLMLPIMGLAFGVSVGDGIAIRNSLLVGLGGVLTAIAVGWLLSQVLPGIFDPEQVGQIMSRTSPRLIDLLAALATGLAGAFAIGRKDVSDTLPGVAIAISLVPPLANVGILLASGRNDLAIGSLLLFVTNYLAIVLTGALVFGLMGYPRVSFIARSKRGKRVAIAVALVMIAVVAVPLGLQSWTTWAKHSVEITAQEQTEAWLEGTEYEFVSVSVSQDDGLDIVVAGWGDLPAKSVLEESLRGAVFGVPVRVEVVATRRIEFQTE